MSVTLIIETAISPAFAGAAFDAARAIPFKYCGANLAASAAMLGADSGTRLQIKLTTATEAAGCPDQGF